MNKTIIRKTDMAFVKETVINWMIAPEYIQFENSEEFMDLVLEYFKDLADVLRDAERKLRNTGRSMIDVVNSKTVAEHMALYFLNELSLYPTEDILNFTKDLRELVGGH